MKKRRTRKGAVTVEMAFAVPILFVLVFASLEFAGINNMRHTVDNAAYEAARRSIVPGATSADVIAEAQGIMNAVGARNVNVSVTPSTITNETPEINVVVTVPVGGNGWLSMFFSDSDVLTGQCRLLREEF